MKKYLYIAIAAATFASCSQDEVMDFNQEAIDFGAPFVDNVPRAAAVDPSYGTTNALTAFQVWGAVNGYTNGSIVGIFDDVNVTGTVGANSVWNTQNVTQYWIYGATYNFAAVVNADKVDNKSDVTLGANKLPATINYTANGTSDLLYAEAKNIIRTAEQTTDKKVIMDFNHLLSKVKFTAVNTTIDTDYSYNIKNLTITNSPAKGTYYAQSVTTDGTTIPAETWNITNANGSTIIGDINAVTYTTESNVKYECTQEKLLIPADFTTTSLNISYTLEWSYKNEVITSVPNKTGSVAVNLQPGFAYNFVITTGLNDPIQFTVTEYDEWENGNTHDSNDDNVNDYIPAA